ncbi:MAG: hypothetical protein U0228_28105 [Myxococcaceae bacterium]
MKPFGTLAVVCLIAMGARAQDAGLAAGWYVSGKGATGYDVTSVEQARCGGKRGARVASKVPGAGPLALLQTFRAQDYRGERMRYSATVDAQNVTGWAGLFFRADAAGKKTVAFDDMRTRPLRGTRACARVSVVVEVPREAELLTMGLVIEGGGTVELSDVAFDHTDPSMPLTTGVDQVQGRVANVYFTDEVVTTNSPGELRMKLKRQSPGVWRDDDQDASATIDGDQIVVKLLVTGPQPQVLSGRLGIVVQDGVTTIAGDYGGAMMRYPLTITYSADRIDTKWGLYERHLKFEPAPQIAKGCRFYAERASNSQFADVMELCGGVLSPTPPPVETVMAFVMGGFKRMGSGLGIAPQRGAPVLPNPHPPSN